jgi:sigma-B regulation protein RsbU (phosphoserine phosphatase)
MSEGKNILIVNVGQSDLDLMVDLLKPDYEIKVVMGEKKAIEMVCSAEPPDLILLGVMSAEGDSRELCRHLKTDDTTGDIPLILISDRQELIEETRCLEMGAADYIQTPIYPPILRSRIYTHLALRHSLAELRKAERHIKTHDIELADELNVCRKIQRSMLPTDFPAFPDQDEFDVYAALHPAREFGGNFYDFFFIGEDRFCFNIGDVSGKCIPAASFMSIAKSIIKSRAGDDFSTASILTHVNEELCEVNKTATYASLFMGILNIKTGLLVYTNAGHKPPFLKRGKGALEQLDRLHGPVIGTIRGLVYKEDKTVLSKNDMLMTYTDGVSAARDKAGHPFSDQRLADIMSSHEFQTAEDMVQAAVSKVLAFENKSERLDDLTVLAVQFLRTPQETTGPKLELTVSNHVSENARVKEHFDTFAEHYNIPKQVRLKMHVVFDELLTNIISYAYPDDKEHDIGIKVELSADRLKVSMVDDGIPFNPLGFETPDTDLPLEEREIGGLGIHLVRRMMDKVSYRRRIDKNVITVYEYLEVDNE